MDPVRLSPLLVLSLAVAAGCASSPGAEYLPPWSGTALPAPVEDAGLRAAMDECLRSEAPLPPFAFVGDPLRANPWAQEGPSRELPPVDVTADRGSEEEKVGPYGQPDWTTQRRFARSRVYVLAPGQWETELWYRGKYDNGHDSSRLFQTELGVGLPHRFQVDYYENFSDADGAGIMDLGPQIEGRWAFADWGRLPWNPTAYLEYKWNKDEADVVEAKLLLGDAIAPRWHAAANLVLEQETSGARVSEFQITGAVSYTVIDSKFSIGAEMTANRVTENGSRNDSEHEVAVGPSLQWRFARNAHLDIVPMMGITKAAHDLDLFIVVGWDFGGGGSGLYAPTSSKSR